MDPSLLVSTCGQIGFWPIRSDEGATHQETRGWAQHTDPFATLWVPLSWKLNFIPHSWKLAIVKSRNELNLRFLWTARAQQQLESKVQLLSEQTSALESPLSHLRWCRGDRRQRRGRSLWRKLPGSGRRLPPRSSSIKGEVTLTIWNTLLNATWHLNGNWICRNEL